MCLLSVEVYGDPIVFTLKLHSHRSLKKKKRLLQIDDFYYDLSMTQFNVATK